jgi:exopolyphosphatase/guanosine-5'-triphosphate,3'-diphosphate pyrophosphatase
VRAVVLGPGGDELARWTEITRVGAGIARTGRLDPDGVRRTLEVLRGVRAELDHLGVGPVDAVGTAAVRRAEDRDAFFDDVAGVLGVRPRVLDGDEEARASFAGAVAGLDGPLGEPVLVVDLGGGSTELARGAGDGDLVTRSLPVGCVTLTEAELHADPPRPEELTNAIGHVTALLDDVLREEPALAEPATLVGVGGTITTVAAVEIGLAVYDRAAVDGFVLTRDAAEDVFRTLATERLADRIHNPGLQAARADVIVGGCCILVALLRRLRRDHLVVRDADLLDALAHRLLAEPRPDAGR